MALSDLFASLEAQPFAQAISQSPVLFPAIETLHVTALVLVVGSIAMLDLRLLGVSRRDYGVLELAAETLPWTWGSFAIAAISGFLLFSSAAVKYSGNLPFRIKFVLLLLAGINMAIFHVTAYRSAHEWNHRLPTPVAARVAGSLSLAFWIGVVFAGRWIGFV